MARSASPTLQILREIRDELRQTNQRLDQTNLHLDQTNERLERLEQRQSQSELRVSTELVAVARAVGEVRDLLRDNLGVRRQVEDHEMRISALERGAG